MEVIDFSFKTPQDSSGYLLAQLTLIWERRQKNILAPLGITLTQFVVLSSIGWLARQSQDLTQAAIADFNNYDRMMVSKVLRTLENKKLITRHAHATDTRAKIVRLTPQGTARLQAALLEFEKADGQFFATLQDDLPAFNESMHLLIAAHRTGTKF